MPPDRDDLIDGVVGLLQQFGLELAFIDPVEENKVERIAPLLERLEDLIGEADDLPEPVVMAMIAIRRWVDDRIAVDRCLNAETILLFQEWQPWMIAAVTAWKRRQAVAAAPAAWARGARPSIWPTPEEADAPAAPAPPGAPAPPVDPARTVAPTAPPAPPSPPPVPAAAPPVAAAHGVEAPDAADIDMPVLPEGIDEEMLRLFCAEAEDLLGEIEQGVLVLESDPADPRTLDRLFRAFHTFKGNVGVVNLSVLQQFTHEMESLLDAARKGRLALGRDAIAVILAGADLLGRFVREMGAQLAGEGRGRSIPLPVPRLLAAVHAALADGPAPVPAAPPLPAPVPPAAAVPPAIVAVAATPAAAAPDAATLPVPPAAPPAPPAPAGAEPGRSATGIVRVDTQKLDGLIDLVGELVIAQSLVVQHPTIGAVADQQLARSLAQLRGITSDLQRTAMSLRMVPVRATFQRMTRLVRDLAVQQGKEIRLVLDGEDTELDRGLVEDLADPLVHMIRNSADHGVEDPAAREAAGKPRAGTIRLRAFHRGGFVVVEVSDDGRGLDPARILAKAVERRIVDPHDTLDTRQILDLIFAPGFSTAERVTDISGRGVGMDVVRRNVERLRGKIEIDSTPGAGTRFTISLPLTLAIIEAVIVGVGEERYVIPTLAVRESFRPRPGQVATVQGKGEMVSLRGRMTPLLRLADHLRVTPRTRDVTEGIVVVVESGSDARCLLVDDLLGKQEVVIKSLGDLFARQSDFAGAAILGDGRIGLILDTAFLVKLPRRGGEAA
ncbi:MAG: chemotaxis protein CheA [Planctomycetaceae bacterium]